MAQTINDIPVTSAAWVNLNTQSGIAVGTPMFIVNESLTWVRLFEGSTAPALDYSSGITLTNKTNGYADAYVERGSLAIWALSTRENQTVNLSVQQTS